jgi:hypothetical protein
MTPAMDSLAHKFQTLKQLGEEKNLGNKLGIDRSDSPDKPHTSVIKDLFHLGRESLCVFIAQDEWRLDHER